jgi:SPP1 family predicted phage head-tail adaptor
MKAAQFKSRVDVQQKVITATGSRGQPLDFAWTNVATKVPAKIEELSGRKLEIARQLVPTATHMVTIRYLPQLKRNMQLVYKQSLILNIGNISNKQMLNFTMEIICISQAVNNGN